MADRHPNVATPYVQHRRAPAVVAVVHAEEIAALVARANRQQPVRAAFVGRGLVRPERGLSVPGGRCEFIAIVGVAEHLERCAAEVGVDADGYGSPVEEPPDYEAPDVVVGDGEGAALQVFDAN